MLVCARMPSLRQGDFTIPAFWAGVWLACTALPKLSKRHLVFRSSQDFAALQFRAFSQLQTVQQRGAAVIKARKLSSAMSAAKAICDHVRDIWFGTPAVRCCS